MMLELAPPTSIVPRPSPIDHDASALAQSFVDAIVGLDFDRLQSLFAPDVRFRAIIPGGCREASTAAGARAFVEDWFGGTEARDLIGWTLDPVGDRLALGYRLELTEDGERRVVEQHVSAVVDGAVFSDVSLLCSGFRRLTAQPDGPAARQRADSTGDDDVAEAPASKPGGRLDATGLSCATLTPTISATVRGLAVGAVLEIVTDDPGAEEGLRSWARLTGNELLAAEAGPGSAWTFSVRRTPRDAISTAVKGTD